MIGSLLAVGAAVILVFADTGKKTLSGNFSTSTIVWNNLIVSIFFNVFFLRVTASQFAFEISTPSLVFLGTSALFLSEIMFMQSLRAGDFSLSKPFQVFVPIFAIPVSFIFLNEFPQPVSLIGVILCVFGAWLLCVPEGNKSWHAPFMGLFKEPAPRAMIVSAFFGAVSSSLQRIASQSFNPVWYFTEILIVEWLFFSILLLIKKENPLKIYAKNSLLLLGTGILWGLGMTLFYCALSYAPVVNVYVIFQLQLLIALIIGKFFFRETHSLQRLVPTLCMMAGVIMVILAN